MAQGLQRILKQLGSIIVQGEDGKQVVWLWDYANDKARLKSEMTSDEISASEKTKFMQLKPKP